MNKRTARRMAAALAVPGALGAAGAAHAGPVVLTPRANTTVGGQSVTIFAQYTAARPVASVKVFVGTTLVAERKFSPATATGNLTVNWDSTRVMPGAHNITVKCYDRNGQVVGVQTVPVSVSNGATQDTIPPQVAIVTPDPNAEIEGTLDVRILASDNSGQNPYVSVFVDKQLKGVSNRQPYTFSVDTTRYANGSHNLEAWAYDAESNRGVSNSVAFKVNNPGGATTMNEEVNRMGEAPEAEPVVPTEAPVPDVAAPRPIGPTQALTVLNPVVKPAEPVEAVVPAPKVASTPKVKQPAARPVQAPKQPLIAKAPTASPATPPKAPAPAILPRRTEVQDPFGEAESPSDSNGIQQIEPEPPKPVTPPAAIAPLVDPTPVLAPLPEVKPAPRLKPAVKPVQQKPAAPKPAPMRIAKVVAPEPAPKAPVEIVFEPEAPTTVAPAVKLPSPKPVPQPSPKAISKTPVQAPASTVDNPAPRPVRLAKAPQPTAPAVRMPAPTPTKAARKPSPHPVATNREALRPVIIPEVRPDRVDGQRIVHTVRPGESPAQLSKKYGVPLKRLLASNSLGHYSQLRTGQELNIPSPVRIALNDKPVMFDVAPRVEDGLTLAPLRSICQSLGGRLTWNSQLREVRAVGVGMDLRLIIGSKTAYVNGSAVELDAPVRIVEGRTIVPVRFLVDSLRLSAEYDLRSGQINLFRRLV